MIHHFSYSNHGKFIFGTQFGGLFQIFGRFFKIKVKIIKYRLHLDVWKLQSGKMIMETECVRFAKIGGFFNNFGRFFAKLL